MSLLPPRLESVARPREPGRDPRERNELQLRTELTLRFEKDAEAEAQLAQTLRLDRVGQAEFDSVFYPGGHGPMWVLAADEDSVKLIDTFAAAAKPTGVVCHSTGALRHVKAPDGRLLVEGEQVS